MPQTLELLGAFDPFAPPRRGARSGGTRPYVLVDVFTETPLEGNQLAVLTDARDVPEREMQRLAAELKLSETVFILPPCEGGDVSIRIFTPQAELPFAGHPVLGCAIVVGRALERGDVTLETRVGAVSVALRREEGKADFGRMQQPIPTWEPYERERELLEALGVERSGLPVELYCNGPRHVYVALDSEQAVAGLEPDMRALARLGEMGASCFAGSGRRWKTRMFAPALGVPEVWRWHLGKLHVLRLGSKKQYTEVAASRALRGFPCEQMVELLKLRTSINETALLRRFQRSCQRRRKRGRGPRPRTWRANPSILKGSFAACCGPMNRTFTGRFARKSIGSTAASSPGIRAPKGCTAGAKPRLCR